jgi:putative nucleotidyltransferase with HDIG domain
MTKKRLLFVDDEHNILDGLRRMLHQFRNEWEMVFVPGGAEALAELEASPFDVVITDMRMPMMNGVELLAEIKKSRPHITRIILSGHSEQAMIYEAVGLAHQFLAKPCDPGALRAIITRACVLRELMVNESLKATVAKMSAIPSAPDIYAEMIAALQGPNASIQRVGEVISEDPGMSAKVLQLVNSAFFGLPCHISSPSRAVGLLGMDTIKALALAIQVFEQFDEKGVSRAVLDALWSHSMNVGAFSREIAKSLKLDEKKTADAFTGGLLHDVGKLIFVANFPEKHAEIDRRLRETGGSRIAAEIELIGVSHAVAGAYLMGLWGLPDTLIEAIVYHHDPIQCAVQEFSALTIVHAANEIEKLLSTREGSDEPPPATHATKVYLTVVGMHDQWPRWVEICRDMRDRKLEEARTS